MRIFKGMHTFDTDRALLLFMVAALAIGVMGLGCNGQRVAQNDRDQVEQEVSEEIETEEQSDSLEGQSCTEDYCFDDRRLLRCVDGQFDLLPVACVS